VNLSIAVEQAKFSFSFFMLKQKEKEQTTLNLYHAAMVFKGPLKDLQEQ
jgi:hypothetical protein